MTSTPFFAAKEIARRAESLAPLDPGPAAVALLNQIPHYWEREKVCPILSDEIHSAYDRAGEAGGSGFAEISLHTAENHATTWKIIDGLLDSEDSEDRAQLKHILDPSVAFHEPVAHLGSWEGGERWYVVEPEVAREQLGLTADNVRDVVGWLEEIVEAKKARATDVRQIRPVPKDHERTDTSIELVVGVGPYADMLPLPAIIYAVSDLIRTPIRFSPAYVFGVGHPDSSLMDIGSPAFDLGYALAADRSRRQNSTFIDIFPRSITRSIAMRQMPFEKRPRGVLSITHFSMLGDLSIDTDFILHEQYTSPEVLEAAYHRRLRAESNYYLRPDTNFDLSAVVPDPGSVELALLVALRGMRVSAERNAENQPFAGATVSTDAHAWAVHNGLLRSRLTPPLVAETASKSLLGVAWSPPRDPRNPEDRDANANLSWFTPVDNKGRMPRARAEAIASGWRRVSEDIVFKKINEAGISELGVQRKSAEDLDKAVLNARRRCDSIAQALLAPLLLAFPQYSGPIKYLPPEAWMAKIVSSDGHMDYVPYWQASWARRADSQAAPNLQSATSR